jgi:hypothetical protein
MENKEVLDVLTKIGLATIPAVFAFIPAILNWLSSRAMAKGRIGRINQLSCELKFLEQWAAMARDPDVGQGEKVASLSHRVQPELDQILTEYLALRELEIKHRDKRNQYIPPIRKALLLFHPSTHKGWMLQVTFYFLTIFALVLVAQEQWGTPDKERDVPSLVLGLVVIFGPILFFVARAAVRLQNQQEKERADAANLREARMAANSTAP